MKTFSFNAGQGGASAWLGHDFSPGKQLDSEFFTKLPNR
jgi:hypothetical protein